MFSQAKLNPLLDHPTLPTGIIHIIPKHVAETEQLGPHALQGQRALILPLPRVKCYGTGCLTKNKDFTLLRMPSQGGRKVARGSTACNERRGI